MFGPIPMYETNAIQLHFLVQLFWYLSQWFGSICSIFCNRLYNKDIHCARRRKKERKKRLYTHWKGSFRRGKEVLNHIVFLLLEAWTKKSLVAINLEIDLLRWDIWSEPQSPHKKLSCLPFTACYTLRLTPLSMFL